MALGYLCKELSSGSADIIQQVWNDHRVSFMVKAHDSLTSAKSWLPWIHARGRKDTYICLNGWQIWILSSEEVGRQSRGRQRHRMQELSYFTDLYGGLIPPVYRLSSLGTSGWEAAGSELKGRFGKNQ